MLAEATTRAVCAQVQKMRKDAGLQKQDTVEVCYSAPDDQVGDHTKKLQPEPQPQPQPQPDPEPEPGPQPEPEPEPEP